MSGLHDNLTVFILKCFKVFFQAVLYENPIQTYEDSNFFILIILTAFLAIILNTVKCYFTVTVILISLIVNYRAHCFQYLLASCASPIEEWLFPSSGHY